MIAFIFIVYMGYFKCKFTYFFEVKEYSLKFKIFTQFVLFTSLNLCRLILKQSILSTKFSD